MRGGGRVLFVQGGRGVIDERRERGCGNHGEKGEKSFLPEAAGKKGSRGEAIKGGEKKRFPEKEKEATPTLFYEREGGHRRSQERKKKKRVYYFFQRKKRRRSHLSICGDDEQRLDKGEGKGEKTAFLSHPIGGKGKKEWLLFPFIL